VGETAIFTVVVTNQGPDAAKDHVGALRAGKIDRHAREGHGYLAGYPRQGTGELGLVRRIFEKGVMGTKKVDVAVIGAGTAGLVARWNAEKEGASTLLIGREPMGTTCARVGCMPSKLLIAAAESAHSVKNARIL